LRGREQFFKTQAKLAGEVIVKNVGKFLLLALIGLGSLATVSAVQASDSETCWGHCNADPAQTQALQRWWAIAGADDTGAGDATTLQRWWHVAGADDIESVQDEALHRWWSVAGLDDTQPLQEDAALRRWWHVAGADDTETTQDSELYSWHDPAGNDEELETMASYR
jgi:hypothetical protein